MLSRVMSPAGMLEQISLVLKELSPAAWPLSKTTLAYLGWMGDHCLLPRILPKHDLTNPLPLCDMAVRLDQCRSLWTENVLFCPVLSRPVPSHSTLPYLPYLTLFSSPVLHTVLCLWFRSAGARWGSLEVTPLCRVLLPSAWGMAHGPVDFF